jgi:hypothetical protein
MPNDHSLEEFIVRINALGYSVLEPSAGREERGSLGGIRGGYHLLNA